MAEVTGFRGLGYNSQRFPDLSTVIAPPYDVISVAEQEALSRRSPYNVVHLELNKREAGDPDGANGDVARHERASAALQSWLHSGVLAEDDRPALYLYEQRFVFGGTAYAQRSMFASVRLDPWSAGTVLRHEHTLSGPKVERLGLLRSTRVNISPIWSLYEDCGESIATLTHRGWETDPIAHAVDDSNTEHLLRRITGADQLGAISAAFAQVPLYIADGHHRYETALAFAGQPGSPPSARSVLMLLSDARENTLLVLPTHRVVSGLAPAQLANLEARLETLFTVEHRSLPADSGSWPEFAAGLLAQPGSKPPGGRFLLLAADQRMLRLLVLRPAARVSMPDSDVARLDVWQAHRFIFETLLSMGSESIARQEHLRYTRDPAEAFGAVLGGTAQLALVLAPTQVDQLLAVARAGEVMPQKSTYFYPKPATGMIMRRLD